MAGGSPGSSRRIEFLGINSVSMTKSNQVSDDESDGTLSLLTEKNRAACNDKNQRKEDKSTKIQPAADQDVFEIQLNQLQEQLVASMVENQQLVSEVKLLKDRKVENLIKDLHEEQRKRKILEETLRQVLQDQEKGRVSTASHSDYEWEHLSTGLQDQNNECKDGVPQQPPGKISKRAYVRSKARQLKLVTWNFLHERLSDLMNDEDVCEDEAEEEQLAVRKLKENLGRFSDAITPIKKAFSDIEDLFAWKNVWFTLTVFTIYIYAIYTEMYLPLTLLLFLLQMALNFLEARGLAQKFRRSPKEVDVKVDSKEETTTLSEKYQLVLQIAKKVQNTLGMLADNLEKLQSLFTWKHEEASKKLVSWALFFFVVSCFLPTRLVLILLGYGIGIKLFVITPIYVRFPKVKKRYDDFARIWSELPTLAEQERKKVLEHEAELESAKQGASSDVTAAGIANLARVVSNSGASARGEKKIKEDSKELVESAESPANSATWDSIVFCDRFHLPQTEQPLPDWNEGRRCTLMDKESPLSSMKHGRLYLTPNYLCFERNQFHTKKNLAMRLVDITSLRKAKPISFMPGPGMSIEVEIKLSPKPYLFAAMMGRDEAFESIMRAGRKLKTAWSEAS